MNYSAGGSSSPVRTWQRRTHTTRHLFSIDAMNAVRDVEEAGVPEAGDGDVTDDANRVRHA